MKNGVAIAPIEIYTVPRIDRCCMRANVESKEFGSRFLRLPVIGTANGNLINNAQPRHISSKDADLHLVLDHY